jgi:hypothetical protein
LLAEHQPDVVLLSVRGPVVRVLVRAIDSATANRPFIVSGLPGISIPETLLALYYRSQVDLIVLHSKCEIAAFQALAKQWDIEQDFALATLPFLSRTHGTATGGQDIVFAAQAKVPAGLPEREQLIGWLVETARKHPNHRVVLKLRGSNTEAQTHSERYPLDELLKSVPDAPANLVVSLGSMANHLDHAAALVTVSSTATIEAIALGVPVLALDDFGVTPKLINTVFEHSGILASSTDLIAGNYRHPDEHWLDENYFHDPSAENWVFSIEAGVLRRSVAPLPLRAQFRATIGGNIRRVWDRKVALGRYDRTLGGYLVLAIGVPLRGGVRMLRRIKRRLLPTAA